MVVRETNGDAQGLVIAEPVSMGGHMRSGPCVCVPMDVSIELGRREKVLSGRAKTCTAGELRLRRRGRRCGGRCEGIRGLVRAFLALLALLARFLCLFLRALELEALRDGVAVARAELAQVSDVPTVWE